MYSVVLFFECTIKALFSASNLKCQLPEATGFLAGHGGRVGGRLRADQRQCRVVGGGGVFSLKAISPTCKYKIVLFKKNQEQDRFSTSSLLALNL